MNRIIIRTFVTLALLLSISEVASGGTVRIRELLNGAASGAMLGDVSHSINPTNGICTITVTPASTYSVESVSAVKITDGNNAQSRLKVPSVSTPIEVCQGDEENTWLFPMPSVEYDVEVTVNFTVPVSEYYPIWVKGIQVNNVNKDNVLGDGTVRFNPTTSTLSLYGADVVIEDTVKFVRSNLDCLFVNLHGASVLSFENGFVSEVKSKDVPLTFITDEANPGQLSWQPGDNVVFSSGFVVSYENSLQLYESEYLIATTPVTYYNLSVGSTVVSSKNCKDVLGDGTVKYVDDGHVLVLANANLTVPVTCNLEGGLTVYLLGRNAISGTADLITTSTGNALISFTSSKTLPGSLRLTKSEDGGTWISGFAAASVPDDYAIAVDGGTMTIARTVPISPIVAETDNGEKPSTDQPTGALGNEIPDGMSEEDYLNIVVNNMLYTLKAGDYNEGDSNNPDDPSGVDLTEIPSNMEDVLSKIPGTDDYANAFKGLTIEVPAGTGQVMLKGEIGTGAILAVQIGNGAPVLFPNDDYPDFNKLETLYIPYSCAENTFVYIYLYQTSEPSTARAESPFRGRVLGGHIKISNVGASSSAVASDNSYSSQANAISNRVIAYELPASASMSNNRGIVLSAIEVDLGTPLSRGARKAVELMKITELGNSVFDHVDKDKILYIDISDTDIKDMTVNRSAGLFGGFGQNALFYLPADNDDGGEDNVILGDNCMRLKLTDTMDFRAPKDFMAENAELDRFFDVGITSTVFLPFGLAADQAEVLGTFHSFKEIKDANALFGEAETNGTAANTPYIFQPSAAKVEAQNVSIEGLDDTSVLFGNMIGTYEKVEWGSDQSSVYCFAAKDQNGVVAGEFVRVSAGEWLSPFSAYIEVNDAPERLDLVIGDNPVTGISTLNVQSQKESIWYNISGQRLSGKPSVKGLFISNGQKICVK